MIASIFLWVYHHLCPSFWEMCTDTNSHCQESKDIVFFRRNKSSFQVPMKIQGPKYRKQYWKLEVQQCLTLKCGEVQATEKGTGIKFDTLANGVRDTRAGDNQVDWFSANMSNPPQRKAEPLQRPHWESECRGRRMKFVPCLTLWADIKGI